MRRTLLALSLTVALLVAACGTHTDPTAASTTLATSPLPTSTSSTDPTPPPASRAPKTTKAPTTTAGPTTTTTTTVPDTAIVPKKITAAYVDAVLAKLNHIYGNAVRALVATRRLSASILMDLAAVYDENLYGTEVQIFGDALRGGLGNIRHEPGDRRMLVVHLFRGTPTCIFAKVRLTETRVDVHPLVNRTAVYEGLRSTTSTTRASGLNPTRWKFFYDLTTKPSTQVANACRAS